MARVTDNARPPRSALPDHGQLALLRLALLLLAFSSLGTTTASAQQRLDADGQPRWEILEGCRLIPDKTRDGDSFHVKHRSRDYIFRLYSVDAPETDARYPDRNAEQARAFGVPSSAIPSLGEAAAEFTSRWLKQGFTIVTRWENALGQSRSPRYYAIVTVGSTNLATELVRHGHARIHGLHANWPDVAARRRFVAELHRAQAEARRKQRGAFAPSAKTTGTSPPAKLDLNTATVARLDALPGVGPVLAKRIVAARPFRSLDQLRQVPGIGPKTFATLTNHVSISARQR